MNADPVIIYALTALLSLSGLGIAIPGTIMVTRRIKLISYGVDVEGTITAWTEQEFSQSSGSRFQRTILFKPSIRYLAKDGTIHTTEMDRSYDDVFRFLNPVGSSIPLRYHPSSPHRIYDPAYASMFTLPIALTVAGLFLLMFALGLVLGNQAA